jgi:5-formyltetrahydrofolate cyclo-ligase
MEEQISKSELRQTLLKKRRSLSAREWREKSDRLCCQLQSFSLFTETKTVLAYFSFRQEPDLNNLFTAERRWGFPRCVGQSLVWHCWQPEETLKTNKYGIKEPIVDAPLLTPEEIDLILVPTVACDYRGYRLGYGGGFYDRLLSSAEWMNIPTVGIVFDFAYLPQLPINDWDIKLDYICTESEVISY